MNLLVQRNALLDAATLAKAATGKATGNNTSLPCLLLVAEAPGTMSIAGTDTAIRITTPCPANLIAPGSVALDAATFVQVVKAFPEGTIYLDVGESFRVNLKCGPSSYKLTGQDPATFTPAPPAITDEGATVTAADLRKLLDQTAFQIAPDDNKYGLNGAHVETVDTPEGRMLRMVGTDGNRLGWAQVPFTGTLNIGRRMLIPRAAVERLRTLIKDASEPVSLAFSERGGVAKVGGATLDFRLLEAEFPNYKEVLPTAANMKRAVFLDRSAFVAAITRVIVFATDGAHSVRFAFGPDATTLSARKLDAGDSRDEVPTEKLDGEPITMGINGRYMLDVLAAIPSGQVRLQMGDYLAPVLIQGWDGDAPDPNALFVVMPVRLD